MSAKNNKVLLIMNFILFAVLVIAITILLEYICSVLGWTNGIMANTIPCTFCACMIADIVLKILQSRSS